MTVREQQMVRDQKKFEDHCVKLKNQRSNNSWRKCAELQPAVLSLRHERLAVRMQAICTLLLSSEHQLQVARMLHEETAKIWALKQKIHWRWSRRCDVIELDAHICDVACFARREKIYTRHHTQSRPTYKKSVLQFRQHTNLSGVAASTDLGTVSSSCG